jgi:hypothetical protein
MQNRLSTGQVDRPRKPETPSVAGIELNTFDVLRFPPYDTGWKSLSDRSQGPLTYTLSADSNEGKLCFDLDTPDHYSPGGPAVDRPAIEGTASTAYAALGVTYIPPKAIGLVSVAAPITYEIDQWWISSRMDQLATLNLKLAMIVNEYSASGSRNVVCKNESVFGQSMNSGEYHKHTGSITKHASTSDFFLAYGDRKYVIWVQCEVILTAAGWMWVALSPITRDLGNGIVQIEWREGWNQPGSGAGIHGAVSVGAIHLHFVG